MHTAQDADAAARARYTIEDMVVLAKQIRGLYLVALGAPPMRPKTSPSRETPIPRLLATHATLLLGAQEQGQRIAALWSPEAIEASVTLHSEPQTPLASSLDELIIALSALSVVTHALRKALDLREGGAGHAAL